MPSFDSMAIFVQVARSGSFSDAARELEVPLSTVSRRVADLERELDVRLFDRSRRRIRLTDIGTVYFEHCRKGLDAFTFANRVVRERQTETDGELKITVPPNLVEPLFLPVIETFQQRYPKARVRVFVSERMMDLVDDALDLSFRVAAATQPDLVTRKLLTYRHRIVASPAYVAMNAPPAQPADLGDHRRLGFGFQSTGDVTWTLAKGDEEQAITFSPEVSVNDYAALRAVALLGLGVGELPEILCRTDLRQNRLVELLPGWRLPEITLYAVHTGRLGLSRLARLFLDTVVDSFHDRRPA